jgi:DNA-binding MarR family transcriptional regulator
MNQKSGAARRPGAQGFTEKQGEYLAFIYTYTYMFRCSPAEADMQRHFRVSPPSAHQMVVTLERAGLLRRQPGVAEASNSSFLQTKSQSSNGSKSTSQILCDEVLVPITVSNPIDA